MVRDHPLTVALVLGAAPVWAAGEFDELDRFGTNLADELAVLRGRCVEAAGVAVGHDALPVDAGATLGGDEFVPADRTCVLTGLVGGEDPVQGDHSGVVLDDRAV